MKLLVIGIDGVSCERLLDPARLPTVGRLLEIGWHGPLAAEAWTSPAAEVARQGRGSAVISSPGGGTTRASDPGGALREGFARVRELLGAGDADHVEFADSGCASLAARGASESELGAHLALFDAELAETLESLGGETAVLVVSAGAGFVLAGAPGVAGERRDGTRVADLLCTMLELGGYEPPSGTDGKSLLAGGPAAPADAVDEEQQIRDHLRGLGYL